MLIILSAPACLLSFFLAYLCYRSARYQHTLVLVLIGLFMFLLTAGLIMSGYIMGVVIKAETAALVRSAGTDWFYAGHRLVTGLFAGFC